MNTALVIATAVLLQPPNAGQAPAVKVPQRVQAYLDRCEAARAAELKSLTERIDAHVAQNDASDEAKQRLATLRKWIELLRVEPAPLLPIPLPTKRDEVGCLPAASYADPSREHSVDVLEVVDGDDVIVRAWYTVPDGDRAQDAAAAANQTKAQRTFVDLWIRGVDTNGMMAGDPATLGQVFWVSGDQAFDTDCGKRILPKLEPLEVERFRSRRTEE
jgi:hypothetical protein